ncbi:MAG: endonuclease/exonuclease/phosphatase family protein [Pirellulaceae bacterium]
MRIVNWNVERPEIDSPKNEFRVKHLLGLRPDILVLTETSTGVNLGSDFVGLFTEPSPRKPREGEAVAAIWVRKESFKIVDRIVTSDPREAVCVELYGRGARLIVYGSIIPYHGAKGGDRKSLPWQEHKRAIEWHRRDWIDLRRSFPDHRLIAAGDYNQHRDGVGQYGTIEIRQMLSAALDDAKLTCVTEADFVASVGLSRRNIDHVCLSNDIASAVSDIQAWEATVAGTRLSDHNGITVDLDDAMVTGPSR